MEEMTLNYRQEGEYLVPDLEIQDSGRTFGKYGMLRRTHLEKHHPGTYSLMVLNGTLWDHLADVDEAATEQVEQAVKAMAQAQGVDEGLKARDMLAWVGAINALKHQAEEEILRELIYT